MRDLKFSSDDDDDYNNGGDYGESDDGDGIQTIALKW